MLIQPLKGRRFRMAMPFPFSVENPGKVLALRRISEVGIMNTTPDLKAGKKLKSWTVHLQASAKSQKNVLPHSLQ
jgi:hypothetical protein